MKMLVVSLLLSLAACGTAQKPHTGTAYGISTSPGGPLQGPGH